MTTSKAQLMAVSMNLNRVLFFTTIIMAIYYKFPRMTMKQLIETWFLGNQKEKIPPFVLFDDEHVRHLGTSKTKN
jgi:hypothetical protein